MTLREFKRFKILSKFKKITRNLTEFKVNPTLLCLNKKIWLKKTEIRINYELPLEFKTI